MKSPQDMRIIQIDITNACIHKCSNCTRFCGHHKKPFFMDWETFQKAVKSMKGYNGTVGIIGGEPTLHPEFERFVRYLRENPYFPKGENLLVKPTKEFMDVIGRMEQRETHVIDENGAKRSAVFGWGLWSALSNKYKEYYELIQDTFNMQALNDHENIMYHSPIMFTRKETGISDEEWHKLRDNCWAQEAWSATITPKGAFFCEIAGALDMLFDGPGGWPIEPGWWKRKPEEFGDQLKWCELCGIAINTFTRNANDEMDDMSEWYYEKLQEIGSPKVKSDGMVNLLKFRDGAVLEECRNDVKQVRHSTYYDSWFSRFSEGNNWLNPLGFHGVFIIRNKEEAEKCSVKIENAAKYLEYVLVGTDNKSAYEFVSDAFENNDMVKVVLSEKETWGSIMNKILSNAKHGHFVILLNEESVLQENCSSFLKQYVMNPGSLLINDGSNEMTEEFGRNIEMIFSPQAYALKCSGYSEIALIEDKENFIKLWEQSKILPICKDTFTETKYHIEPDVKYAIYGAGPTANYLYEQFSAENIVCIADSDYNKLGELFHGHMVISPEELYSRRSEYDKIFIASNFFFEIKSKLLEMGFEEESIVSSLVAL